MAATVVLGGSKRAKRALRSSSVTFLSEWWDTNRVARLFGQIMYTFGISHAPITSTICHRNGNICSDFYTVTFIANNFSLGNNKATLKSHPQKAWQFSNSNRLSYPRRNRKMPNTVIGLGHKMDVWFEFDTSSFVSSDPCGWCETQRPRNLVEIAHNSVNHNS